MNIATQLLDVGERIREVNEHPENFSVEYLDKLEVERIGLLSRYYRTYYKGKVTHIDARRFKTGKL